MYVSGTFGICGLVFVINFVSFSATVASNTVLFLSSHAQTPHLCDCPTVLSYSATLFLAFSLCVPIFRASAGCFSGLLILSSAVSGSLMSPSKAIFSSMTLISMSGDVTHMSLHGVDFLGVKLFIAES